MDNYARIVIQQAVWLYFLFALSYRDVEDIQWHLGGAVLIVLAADDAIGAWLTLTVGAATRMNG